jgi:hypothetical protein
MSTTGGGFVMGLGGANAVGYGSVGYDVAAPAFNFKIAAGQIGILGFLFYGGSDIPVTVEVVSGPEAQIRWMGDWSGVWYGYVTGDGEYRMVPVGDFPAIWLIVCDGGQLSTAD